jgi:predicted TIM-barrel fold metal-dependent hydrolase
MDRLIFSTDYPFQQPTRQDITAFLRSFRSEEEREMFTSTNAVGLFGIEPPPVTERAPSA